LNHLSYEGLSGLELVSLGETVAVVVAVAAISSEKASFAATMITTVHVVVAHK
jgi:hypothetical protein